MQLYCAKFNSSVQIVYCRPVMINDILPDQVGAGIAGGQVCIFAHKKKLLGCNLRTPQNVA